MKIDWKRKITSRKLWVAGIGLVSGILTLFKVDAKTVETIAGLLLTLGSVIAYIVGEGLVDAANVKQNQPEPLEPQYEPPDPEA